MKLSIMMFIIIIGFTVSANAQFSLEDAFPNLSFTDPVDLRHPGDGTDRLFAVEQSGRIKVFQNSSSVTTSKIFLDITDRVSSGGEMGLLGLAFHPDYADSGYFYVNYTAANPRRTIVSRFSVTSNPDSADKNSEMILFTFNQPFSNHNGGWVGFGPEDGYLYISTGDGGSGGDPQDNAQNIHKFLGKILRIDVDHRDAGMNYSIPPTNPFFDSTGTVVREIYAWGMRNPWRNSFDPATGWLWTADVGQNMWEEIDIIENGKNYGWRCYEGNHEFNTSNCNYPEYTFPIWEYSHGQGCSITGGYVYRGPNVPEIFGKYIYADYCTKTVWALTYNGVTPPSNETLLTAPGLVVGFGTDQNKELYVLTFSPDKIYKFVPTAPVIAPSGLTGEASITSGVPPQIIVDLWWNDNSDNETGFVIERKTSNSNFTIVGSTAANETTFTDQSVLDSTTYIYRVRAVSGADSSGYSNEFTVTTPLRTLAAPTDLVATATGPDEVALNWTDNSVQEVGYKIERKTGVNGNYSLLDSVAENVTTYSDQSVEANTLYYYRVFAYLDQFLFSDYSNEDSAQTPNPSGVDDSKIPESYNLEQNYPNPFNPSTKIKFSLPETSDVNIIIYNSLGKQIDTVLQGTYQAGFYEQTWTPKNLASGIYYLKMTASSSASNKNYSSTVKMIFLK